MYSLYIPMFYNEDYSQKEELVSYLKKAKTDRVFILFNQILNDPIKLERELAALSNVIGFFDRNGIKTGVWIFPTLGCGNPKSIIQLGENTDFTRIKTLIVGNVYDSGVRNKRFTYGSFCPMDKNFTKAIAELIAKVALYTDTIFLEDDFSITGMDFRDMTCCCKLHMAEFRKRTNEKIATKDLADKVYFGDKKYRDIWYDIKKDTVLDFFKAIRKKVDEVAPETRVGFCANRRSFDLDGATIQEMAKTLAGNTKPLIRLTGAPYWEEANLATNIETVRLQTHWLGNDGMEIVSEGDTCPRPKCRVSANFLEYFDMILRADDKTDGIYKYMVEYKSKILYDTGYLDRHIKNMKTYEYIDKIFSGKQTVGVNIFENQSKIRNYTFDETETFEKIAPYYVFDTASPTSLVMSKDNSLPTAYDAPGYARIVFGENAKYVDEDMLSDGMVLDFKSAKLLHDRGIDVGFERYVKTSRPFTEIFTAENDVVVIKKTNADFDGDYFDMKLKDGAIVDSWFSHESVGTSLTGRNPHLAKSAFPACYKYENSAGQRFMVYSFTASTVHVRCISPWTTGLFRCYYRQTQLISGIEWVQRKKLPAVCVGNPDLFILCKSDDKELSVGLWNFSTDNIPEAIVTLDKEYASVECYNTTGVLRGNQVCLTEEITPYGYAFLTLKK